MQNYIFLDIDGVLNYYEYVHDEKSIPIDESKVELLKQIVDVTNARIVLSSTWRMCHDNVTGQKEKIYIDLENILAKHGLFIYEDLPQLNLDKYEGNTYSLDLTNINDLQNDIEYNRDIGTGYDISEYVKKHNIKSYIILDDIDWNFEYYGLKEHWIQTFYWTTNGGLQDKDVKKAIDMFM